MARFAEAMKANVDSEGYNVSHAAAGYNWKELWAGLVVDVSISVLISIRILTFTGRRIVGHASIAIANAAPKLLIIIQDLPEIVSRAKQRCQQH